MSGKLEQGKPSCDEWLRWTQVVVDKLTAIVHGYNTESPDAGFLPEKERRFKSAQTLEVLRHLYTLSDSLSSVPSGPGARDEEEKIISSVSAMLPDILRRLPVWSRDMQVILKSPWYGDFPTRAAGDLFFGVDGNEDEGIGSGQIEHGRLPAIIDGLLARESSEGERPKRGDISGSGDRRRELSRRWSDRNAAFMRSAGRVS